MKLKTALHPYGCQPGQLSDPRIGSKVFRWS
jgi:hypothetical protein